MKPRERVLKALEHKEPDRVPADPLWIMNPIHWRWMKGLLGVVEDEQAWRAISADMICVYMDGSPEFKRNAKLIGSSDYVYGVPLPDGTFADEWGTRYQLVKTRNFFRHVYHPLEDKESLKGYELPDIDASGRFDAAAAKVKKHGETYFMGGHMMPTLIDQAIYLRGERTLIKDLYTNPRFVESLLDKILEFKAEQAKRFAEAGVDYIMLSDDIGIQNSMRFSPHVWRRFIKPRMKSLIYEAKKTGQITHVFYHSDGYFDPVIPDLIEVGVDMLNPIQPEAMNPSQVKQKYGDRLTLHGTISIQETLPKGRPEDVEREVVERIRSCGRDGGLIISHGNRPTPDVPPENLIAIYRGVQRYGQYPIKL